MFRNRITLALAASLASVLAAGLIAATSAQAQSNWQMQQAQIIDRNGFGQPIVAATIMVPTGMKTTGGVRWRLQANVCPQGHTFDWQACSDPYPTT